MGTKPKTQMDGSTATETPTPTLTEARVGELQKIFMEHDTDKKSGKAPASAWPTLLSKAGFKFSEKTSGNLMGLYALASETEVYFMEYLSCISWLTVIKEVYDKMDEKKSGAVSVAHIGEFLAANGYEFDDSTDKVVGVVADRGGKGTFSLEDSVFALLFIRFALTHFDDADEDGSGDLDFDEIRSKFGYLGLADISLADAKKVYDEADIDKSGTIGPEEFIVLVITLKFADRVKALAK